MSSQTLRESARANWSTLDADTQNRLEAVLADLVLLSGSTIIQAFGGRELAELFVGLALDAMTQSVRPLPTPSIN